MTSVDESLYTPVDSPLYAAGQSLCELLRMSAAMQALCAPLIETTADTAVVHCVGDEPPDVRGWTVEDMQRIGCRAFVGPADEEWLRVAEDSSTGLSAERYAFDIELRRMVLPMELATLKRPRMFAWFYSQTAALPQQLMALAGESCLVLRSVEGLLGPAFNSKEEAAAQGLILHTMFRVVVGDRDA